MAGKLKEGLRFILVAPNSADPGSGDAKGGPSMEGSLAEYFVSSLVVASLATSHNAPVSMNGSAWMRTVILVYKAPCRPTSQSPSKITPPRLSLRRISLGFSPPVTNSNGKTSSKQPRGGVSGFWDRRKGSRTRRKHHSPLRHSLLTTFYRKGWLLMSRPSVLMSSRPLNMLRR